MPIDNSKALTFKMKKGEKGRTGVSSGVWGPYPFPESNFFVGGFGTGTLPTSISELYEFKTCTLTIQKQQKSFGLRVRPGQKKGTLLPD